MGLKDYQSHCKKNQKIIICQDKKNPQKYVAHNEERNDVYQYLFDGDVVKEGKRCDYLLLNDTKKRIYFVELKGSDLNYALVQIEESVKVCKTRFSDEINGCSISFRVILNKVRSPNLYTNDVKKFKKRVGSDLVYKTLMYEEKI